MICMVLIQQNLQSTAKKVKFFVETIAAEMKHTETPNTDTGPEVNLLSACKPHTIIQCRFVTIAGTRG